MSSYFGSGKNLLKGGGGGFADRTCEFNMMDKVRVYMYNLCTQWSVVGHFWLLAPEPHFLSVK